MVTIKFYKDPVKSEHTECQFNTLVEYLSESSFSKDQLLDFRFFHDEILGQEIDQSDSSFLDISEGVVAITLDSMIPRGPETWIYLAIAAVVAIVTILLVPKPELPASRDQQSATNGLGSPSNEPRINQRIDDIFGSVTKHTPPLWQVPYRIGVDNQETEILLMCVGRGKYLLEQEKLYDGNTRIIDIPNAQFSKYEPGTYPGNGTPSLQIGDDITEKIGIYRQSNDLNPSELLPPNDLFNSGLEWKLTGNSPTEGLMEAITIPTEFNFEEYYNVGDIVLLEGINYFEADGTTDLYYDLSGNATSAQFDVYKTPVDISDNGNVEYEITGVTSNTITVIIPNTVSQDITNAWAAMTAYVVINESFFAFNFTNTAFTTLSIPVLGVEWFGDTGLTTPVDITSTEYTQLVGKKFNAALGPFNVPDGATEIILNFVSESGFYKLNNNNETSIVDSIEIKIEELDNSGDPTGLFTDVVTGYFSNTSVRKSVFKTARIVLPYTKARVSASRLGNRDKSDGISNVDIIKWRDLYTFEPVNILDFGDVTLAHVVIPSNSESQLIKERKQNMDVTRLITEYIGNGVFGSPESFATDDFAQILTHISLDPRIGRLTLDNINADGFLLRSDQIKTYFGSDEMVRFGHDFDDTNVTYQDMFIRICEVVNCLPYVQNGVYDNFFEGRQAVSSMQVTCRNKIINSESREQIFEREHDGVEVSYRDENSSISETIYLPNDRSALNPDRRELPGCVTAIQAFRYASRIFNKQLYSRLKVSFDVDEFGRNIIPGKRIDSPDSTRFTLREGVTDGYRIYDGEVIEALGLSIELSEPVTFIDGEDHYIVFTKENGDNSESILCTRVDDFRVSLSVLPLESVYDGYSKDRTKYTFSSEQLRDSVALIPQTIEFKVTDEGSETNTIGSINYSDQYYKDDLEFPT